MNSFIYILFSIILLNSTVDDKVKNFSQDNFKNEFIYSKISNESNCKECHSELISLSTVHPVAEDCETCHQPNGADHSIITKAFNFSDKLPQLCYTCHDGVQSSIDKSQIVHGPVSDKRSCVNCHSPHSSAQSKLLKKESKELCLSCHNKLIDNKNHKIANIKQKVTTAKYIHAAVEDGCLTCHKPHSSDRKNLLADKFPSHEYTVVSPDSFALCFNCHDAAMIEKPTSNSTSFRDKSKNLHFLHVNGNKGRSCTLCHDVHGSDNEHLIKSKVLFGNYEMTQTYRTTGTGGSCKNACHSEKAYER